MGRKNHGSRCSQVLGIYFQGLIPGFPDFSELLVTEKETAKTSIHLVRFSPVRKLSSSESLFTVQCMSRMFI